MTTTPTPNEKSGTQESAAPHENLEAIAIANVITHLSEVLGKAGYRICPDEIKASAWMLNFAGEVDITLRIKGGAIFGGLRLPQG